MAIGLLCICTFRASYATKIVEDSLVNRKIDAWFLVLHSLKLCICEKNLKLPSMMPMLPVSQSIGPAFSVHKRQSLSHSCFLEPLELLVFMVPVIVSSWDVDLLPTEAFHSKQSP